MRLGKILRPAAVCRGALLAALLVGGTVPIAMGPLAVGSAHAQGAITGNQTTTAIVETIDPVEGNVLLRDENDGLITLEIPRDAHNLPRLQPGDRISLRFFQTIDAELADPGTPVPQSTVSSARGISHRHPHGTLVSFRRQRVRIVAVDLSHHVVTLVDASGANRTVTVHQKVLFPLMARLKTGDAVDVTTMDATSFTVLSRVVDPTATVQENGAAAVSTPVAPSTPVPATPPADAAAPATPAPAESTPG